MKIINLQAENIKRITAVEITPDGNMVQITGKNGAGKSSVLDSIWYALAGGDVIPGQPIRTGENKAHIRLDMGELIVERRFTDKGTYLSVTTADGDKKANPQTMLNGLIGELSFDPLAFANMDAKKQFNELRRVAKLEIDVDELDRLNKEDFEKRTNVNRDAKAKRAAAGAIMVPADLPAEPVDEADLLDQMEQAAEHNTRIETRKANRAKVTQDAADARAEAENKTALAARLRKEADDADAAATAALETATELEAKLAAAQPLPEPIDVADVRAKLDAAKATNAGFAAKARRAEVVAEAAALEKESDDLTAAMEGRTKAKQDAIAAAEMPVPGLGLGDGIVTYNGVPFDQASTAEQLRVSLAIAMAANPELRVIRIQHGNDLDEDNLKLIAEMATAQDYQIWIERVDSSGQVGFVIEDGHVKGATVAAKAPAEAEAEPETVSETPAQPSDAPEWTEVVRARLGTVKTVKAVTTMMEVTYKDRLDALATTHPAIHADLAGIANATKIQIQNADL